MRSGDLSKEEKLSKAKSYVYRLLTRRMHTSKEVSDKLTSRGYSDEIIQDVMLTMERYGYINDRVFAEEWIRSRMRTKPKGRAALKRELIEKGIEVSIIEEVLNKTLDELNEIDIILELARRRAKLYNSDDPETARRKLQGFLIRRGFDFEIVRDIVEQVMKERDEQVS